MTIAARRWLRELAGAIRANALLLAIYLVFGAILSIAAGQDFNWDLLNYHFYTPFQLLDDRFDRDVDVATIQTYMNPLFDLPFFVAVRVLRMPPIVIGASLGAFHGLALFFVHKIMVALLAGWRRGVAHIFGGLAAAIAAFGAGFHSAVGGTMGDATVSVFVLGAIWQLVSRAERDGAPTRQSVAWAGLLVGVALGKLTAAIYLAGLGLAVVIVGRSIRGRLVRAATFTAFAICGAAISLGYWAWVMNSHFGDPAFPYLTQVIAEPTKPLGRRYLPRDAAQATFYPFYFALRPQALMVSEVSFSDARVAAGYCGVVLFAVVAGARAVMRRGALRTVEDGRLLLLIVTAVASFLVWQREASIYRYALPIEMIASTVILGSLVYTFRRGVRALSLAAPVCVFLIATTQAPTWGRIAWQSDYFGMAGVRLDQYENATIFLWEIPNAYLVPYFPRSSTFLRIGANGPTRLPAMLKLRLEWAVQGANRQKVYLLETNPGVDLVSKENVLEQLGLTLDVSECHGFSNTSDIVRICAVRYLDR